MRLVVRLKVSKNICSEGKKHSTEYFDVFHKKILLILMYTLLCLHIFIWKFWSLTNLRNSYAEILSQSSKMKQALRQVDRVLGSVTCECVFFTTRSFSGSARSCLHLRISTHLPPDHTALGNALRHAPDVFIFRVTVQYLSINDASRLYRKKTLIDFKIFAET
jgi:hypothetical protein